MNSWWLSGTRALACLGVALASGACSKKAAPTAAEPGPAPSASAVAAAPASAAPAAGAVCTVSGRSVWGKWANQRTGITATHLADGRVALGAALGDDPVVLVFDRSGKGELHRVSVPKDLPLGADIPKAQGRRDLQRVTPAIESDGDLVAYADYRDRWKSGRRRISCGQADEKKQLLEFDGTPVLDVLEKEQAAKPTLAPTAQTGVAHAGVPPGASGAVTPRPRLALPGVRLKPLTKPRPVIKLPATVSTPVVATAKTRSEIRDCRSFVDPGGKDVWAAATELYGEDQSDGSVKWSMRLLVLPHPGASPLVVYKVALPAKPKKLETFETAVAAHRPDGGNVLFARYDGGLLGWTLDTGRHRQSGPRRWGGGYPSPPRLLADGTDLVAVTALKHGAGDYLPRFARIGASGLPASLSAIGIAGAQNDVSEPVLARAGDQRWLAFHAGKRREGTLRVVPVDDKLASSGRAFDVTGEGETAYESFLVDLDGGRLLVVYIQGGGSPQLVSETLTCKVAS